MRAPTLLTVLGTIFLFTTLILSHPLAPAPFLTPAKSLTRALGNPAVEWAPDQPVCANSPHTIAGT